MVTDSTAESKRRENDRVPMYNICTYKTYKLLRNAPHCAHVLIDLQVANFSSEFQM